MLNFARVAIPLIFFTSFSSFSFAQPVPPAHPCPEVLAYHNEVNNAVVPMTPERAGTIANDLLGRLAANPRQDCANLMVSMCAQMLSRANRNDEALAVLRQRFTIATDINERGMLGNHAVGIIIQGKKSPWDAETLALGREFATYGLAGVPPLMQLAAQGKYAEISTFTVLLQVMATTESTPEAQIGKLQELIALSMEVNATCRAAGHPEVCVFDHAGAVNNLVDVLAEHRPETTAAEYEAVIRTLTTSEGSLDFAAGACNTLQQNARVPLAVRTELADRTVDLVGSAQRWSVRFKALGDREWDITRASCEGDVRDVLALAQDFWSRMVAAEAALPQGVTVPEGVPPQSWNHFAKDTLGMLYNLGYRRLNDPAYEHYRDLYLARFPESRGVPIKTNRTSKARGPHPDNE